MKIPRYLKLMFVLLLIATSVLLAPWVLYFLMMSLACKTVPHDLEYPVKVLNNDEGIYLVGSTDSIDFPTTFSSDVPLEKELRGIYISKFNHQGSLIWSRVLTTFINTSLSREAPAIIDASLDRTNHLLIYYISFIDSLTDHYEISAYYNVAKLTSDGQIAWNIRLTDLEAYYQFNEEEYRGIAVDNENNFYITGICHDNGQPSEGEFFNYGLTKIGEYIRQSFIMKFSSNGQRTWTVFIGGDSSEESTNIAVDKQGNIIVTGITYSKNFPIVNCQLYSSDESFWDGFILKLYSNGSLSWSTRIGGTWADDPLRIAIDESNCIIIVGETLSNDYPIKNMSIHETLKGNSDIFLSKFDSNGTLMWSTYLGSSSRDSPSEIIIAENNTIYLGGSCYEKFEGFDLTTIGETSYYYGFFVSINQTAGNLIEGFYYSESPIKSLTYSSSHDLIIAGYTRLKSFPILSPVQSELHENEDSYLMKYSTDFTLRWSTFWGGTGYPWYICP